MRKLLTMLAVVGALAASQCFAATVHVTRIPGYFSGEGGEFNITPVFGSGYADSVKVAGGIETFCADIGVSIGIPGDYITGTITPINNPGVGFLYSQFAAGTLATYDYTPGVIREADAKALQDAIWHLLGQLPTISPEAQKFVDMTVGAVGNYDVFELPLSTASGAKEQPMLFFSPPGIPDGGLTVMLLGFSLTGIGWLSRRCKA